MEMGKKMGWAPVLEIKEYWRSSRGRRSDDDDEEDVPLAFDLAYKVGSFHLALSEGM